MTEQDQSSYLPTKKVLQRYEIADRTLDRWLADRAMNFPRPLMINRRRYFKEVELTAWERKRAAAK